MFIQILDNYKFNYYIEILPNLKALIFFSIKFHFLMIMDFFIILIKNVIIFHDHFIERVVLRK
jgi:hypothetical protein